MSPRWSAVVAVAVVVPVATLALSGAPIEHYADRRLQVEFVTPTDWLCATRGGCVTCQNVAVHTSRVRLRWPDGEWGDYEVEAASSLELCSGLET